MSKFEYTKDEVSIMNLDSRIEALRNVAEIIPTLVLPKDVQKSVEFEIERQIALINNLLSDLMNKD